MERAILKYACSICKKGFEFEKIRYFNNKNRIICKNCFDKLKQTAPVETEIKEPVPEVENVNLICYDCKFKFSLKKRTKRSLKCPYCDRSRIMKDETSAALILDDVTKNPDYYL
ncbi:MAG: hypothetical protein ABII01_05445 [Candidatus Woesearchaeota archaeon]